jgi:hypothetical protein
MKRFSVAVGVVALALVSASQAAAAVYVVKGVAAISDYSGVIGAPGSQFSHAFTLTFTRNDAVGNFQDAGVYSQLSGDGANNPVTATLEIGAFSYDFGSTSGYQFQRKAPGTTNNEGFLFGATNYEFSCNALQCINNQEDVAVNASSGIATSSYLPDHLIYSLPSLTKAETPDFFWTGHFAIDRVVFALDGSYFDEQRVFGQFDLSSITVVTSQGVPEPASWALMLLGFAVVGHALRRRPAPHTA